MFNYYVENTSIIKDKDSFIIQLKGWAFDSNRKISFEATDEFGKVYSLAYQISTRDDVYKYFHNSTNALDSGFLIDINGINNSVKSLNIQFYDENHIELGTHIIDVQELKNIYFQKKISLKNLHKVIKSIKRDGIRTTSKKIISKLSGSSNSFLEESDIIEPYIYQDEKFSYSSSNEYNIVAVINASSHCIDQNDYNISLENIIKQNFKKVIVLVNKANRIILQKVTDTELNIDLVVVEQEMVTNKEIIKFLYENVGNLEDKYISIVSAGDILARSTVSRINEALDRSGLKVITSNEDRIFEGEFIAPYYKNYAVRCQRSVYSILRKSLTIHGSMFAKFINQQLEYEDIYIIDKVLYHYKLSSINEKSKVKPIAFYLPQFHTFPENDEWWGKGFTEWTNTRKGRPLFNGHYQPHNPGELGFYDLVEDESIQHRQIELAKEYGIYGFCYYYYWFNGKRLMEKPLDRLIADKSLNFPFCICWANETWSRRWDGQDKEILIKQEHNEETDNKFIEDIIPILKDERYIKVGNAPILLIYRSELFPNLEQTIRIWKQKCKDNGIDDLHVSLVQSFGLTNPTVYGGDSAVEFPPHSIVTANIASEMPGLNKNFIGNIYDYRDVVSRCLNKKPNCYKVFRGTMLGWDNTARRKNASNIFYYSDPKEYKKWLSGIIDYTTIYNNEEEQFIFINAWNEWAEGTHLEPDEKYGRSYLEKTKEALESNY